MLYKDDEKQHKRTQNVDERHADGYDEAKHRHVSPIRGCHV
jgi:hypothetical protein